MRVGILISGRGSNMVALIEAAKRTDAPHEIGLVISNRPNAKGLVSAAEHGIPTLAIDHGTFDTREAFDQTVDAALTEHKIDLVCLAGFMRILTTPFVEAWAGRMLNIHPSLLPAFKGIDAQAQALNAGVAVSGCTVHFVVPELDAGPIIGQAVVPVHPGDTEDTLAARISKMEHRLYPACLERVASGACRLGPDGTTEFIDKDAGLLSLGVDR